jgi:hypothetical protein
MLRLSKSRVSFILATFFLAACMRRTDVPGPVDKAAATATLTRDQRERTVPADPAVATALPSVPGEIGGLELAGYLGRAPIRALTLEGDLAYVGLGRMLEIVRLTDPARPQRVGYVALPDEILDVAVVGIPSAGRVYAYVANGQGGLCVVDVSDPARPVVAGTHYASSHVTAVAVRGAYLYTSAGALRVMHLDDAAAPTEVGTYRPADPMGSAGKVVAVSDGHAYVLYHGGSSKTGGLRIVDVSEPTMPFEVGAYNANAPVRDAAIAGDRAYLLAGLGVPHLVVVDLSDLVRPVAVGPAGEKIWPGHSLDVAGEILHLASPGAFDASGPLQILDVTDPAHPVALGQYEGLARPVTEINVRDKRAYLAAGDRLIVVDVSNPNAPRVAGSYDPRALPGTGRGVAVEGDQAYVAAGEDGLWVVDVSDPANPRVAGNVDTAGHAWGVALWDGTAYVADEHNGLRAIDVRDPAHPVEVGSYDVPGPSEFFCDVAIGAGRSSRRVHAYVADALPGDTSLRVIDVSDPAAPKQVSRLPLGAGLEGDVRAYGVAAAGDYAYLAVGAAGLRVVDVSDPFAPVEVGALDVPGRADNLVVAGDRAYLVDGDLRIVDVYDPAAPREVGFYDVADLSPWPHVAVDGGYVFLTAQGTSVLDSSDPGAPVEVATYDLAQGKIAVANGQIYVLDGGLTLLRPRAPAEATPLTTEMPEPECGMHTAAMSLKATDTQLYVGDVLTVTAMLVNQGCGKLGLPQYSLYAETGQEGPLFADIPEPVVHYLAIAPGQSDTAEFALRASRAGRAVLMASVSFEFHGGYPGPAHWASASSEPLQITVLAPALDTEGKQSPSPTPVAQMPDRAFTSFATTPDGALWYGFDEFDAAGGSRPGSQHYGLYRSHDGRVSRFDLPGTIRSLAVAPNGSLYIGAGLAVWRYADGQLERLVDTAQDRAVLTQAFVPFDIAFGREGDVWVGGVYSVARYDGGTWTRYDVNVRRLLAAPDGSLWGEGWDGLAGSDCCYVHITGNRWVTYTHSAALPVSQELLGDIRRLRD